MKILKEFSKLSLLLIVILSSCNAENNSTYNNGTTNNAKLENEKHI